MTTLENKAFILAQLWMDYRTDEQFDDFFEYNDIGLPLAYAVANQIVEPLPIAVQMIEETWSLFLDSVGLNESDSNVQEWETLEQVFATAEDFGWNNK